MGAADRVDRLRRVGVTAAVVLCAVAGTLWALAVPLFLPADESAHVDYASRVWDGIPQAGRMMPPPELTALGQRRVPQHVSNHPPLYHLIAAPLVRWSVTTQQPGGLLVLRFVGVALACVTVALTATLARLVLAGQRRELQAGVAVAAAGVVAVVPSFVGASASIQNDSLQLVLAALALVLAMRGFRGRFTVRSVLLLGLVCGAGMLTRIAFAPVLVAVLLLVVLGTLRGDGAAGRADDRRRWALAIGRAALVGVVSLLLAGWFFLLNLVRYGDLTGGSAVYSLVRFRRTVTPSVLSQFVDPGMWWNQIAQFAGAEASDRPKTPLQTAIAIALIVVALVAVVGAVLRRRVLARLDGPTRAVLAILLLVFLVCYLELAQHVTNKGSLNNRYLLSALAFLGVVGGLLLVVGGGRRLAALATLATALELVGTVQFTSLLARRQPELRSSGWLQALPRSLEGNGVAAPVAVTVMVLLVVIALAAHAAVLVALAGPTAARQQRPTQEAAPLPSGPRPVDPTTTDDEVTDDEVTDDEVTDDEATGPDLAGATAPR